MRGMVNMGCKVEHEGVRGLWVMVNDGTNTLKFRVDEYQLAVETRERSRVYRRTYRDHRNSSMV